MRRLPFSRHLRSAVLFLVVLVLSFLRPTSADAATRGKYLVYIGTYTEHGSKGIYAYRFDARTGQWPPHWDWPPNPRSRRSSPSMRVDTFFMRSMRLNVIKDRRPER